MVSFGDAERVCAQLPIAASMNCEYEARETNLHLLPLRVKWDKALVVMIRRVWQEMVQGSSGGY